MDNYPSTEPSHCGCKNASISTPLIRQFDRVLIWSHLHVQSQNQLISQSLLSLSFKDQKGVPIAIEKNCHSS